MPQVLLSLDCGSDSVGMVRLAWFLSAHVPWILVGTSNGQYPLVNVYISMERSTIFMGKLTNFLWQFSSSQAVSHYQMVIWVNSYIRLKNSPVPLLISAEIRIIGDRKIPRSRQLKFIEMHQTQRVNFHHDQTLRPKPRFIGLFWGNNPLAK